MVLCMVSINQSTNIALFPVLLGTDTYADSHYTVVAFYDIIYGLRESRYTDRQAYYSTLQV